MFLELTCHLILQIQIGAKVAPVVTGMSILSILSILGSRNGDPLGGRTTVIQYITQTHCNCGILYISFSKRFYIIELSYAEDKKQSNKKYR